MATYRDVVLHGGSGRSGHVSRPTQHTSRYPSGISKPFKRSSHASLSLLAPDFTPKANLEPLSIRDECSWPNLTEPKQVDPLSVPSLVPPTTRKFYQPRMPSQKSSPDSGYGSARKSTFSSSPRLASLGDHTNDCIYSDFPPMPATRGEDSGFFLDTIVDEKAQASDPRIFDLSAVTFTGEWPRHRRSFDVPAISSTIQWPQDAPRAVSRPQSGRRHWSGRGSTSIRPSLVANSMQPLGDRYVSHEAPPSLPSERLEQSEQASSHTTSPTSKSQLGTLECIDGTVQHLLTLTYRLEQEMYSQDDSESDDLSEDSPTADDSWNTSEAETTPAGSGSDDEYCTDAGDQSETNTNTSGPSNQSSGSPNGSSTLLDSSPSGRSSKHSRQSSQGDGDDGDGRSRKRPRKSDESPTGNSQPLTKKNAMQMRCIVDGCDGLDTHISELIRKLSAHHGMFVCQRCYTSFDSDIERKRHCEPADTCEPYCVSSTCDLRSDPHQSNKMVSSIRHKKTNVCPKIISNSDRWSSLFHLKYPERQLPPFVQTPGESHPHANGRPRPKRKHKVAVDTAYFEDQLKATRSNLETIREQRECEAKISEMEKEERERRAARLENIISACIGLLTAYGNIPDWLRRLIDEDAPSVLRSSSHTSQIRPVHDIQATDMNIDTGHEALYLPPKTFPSTVDNALMWSDFTNMDFDFQLPQAIP